jgi:hypothetical protein
LEDATSRSGARAISRLLTPHKHECPAREEEVDETHAQELLGKGGVIGKIVLVRNGSSLESEAA